jgi:hypothetical protein
MAAMEPCADERTDAGHWPIEYAQQARAAYQLRFPLRPCIDVGIRQPRMRHPPVRLRTRPLARVNDRRAVRLASLPKAQPVNRRRWAGTASISLPFSVLSRSLSRSERRFSRKPLERVRYYRNLSSWLQSARREQLPRRRVAQDRASRKAAPFTAAQCKRADATLSR